MQALAGQTRVLGGSSGLRACRRFFQGRASAKITAATGEKKSYNESGPLHGHHTNHQTQPQPV